MSDEAYSKITGVKCGRPERDLLALERVMDETTKVNKEQVYKELDELMSTSFQVINKTFRDMDKNRDGTLQPEELRMALKAHGMTMTDENFEDLWSDFDEVSERSLAFFSKTRKQGLYRKRHHLLRL